MEHQCTPLALLAIATFSAGTCLAQQAPAGSTDQGKVETVIVSTDGFAKAASNHVTAISAECPGSSYKLRIAREEKTVTLVLNDSGVSTDISTTAFGTTFLDKHLYGKFVLTCPQALASHFYGFEAQDAGAPKAVSYTVIIRDNGDVISDSGLQYDPKYSGNYLLTYRPKRR